MAKMYYEADADMSLVDGKTFGIIGYGSQGHAHALNLHDNGLDVMVGLYEGSSSIAKAEADGLKVGMVAEVAEQSDIIMMLIPDHLQSEVYRESIQQHMLPGKTLMFAHGFNIHYNTIQAPEGVDVSMVAPKAPGHRMREVFTKGSGRAGSARSTSGRYRQRACHRSRVCKGRWLHARRCPRHDIQGRDRDRSVRRAGRAVRRCHRSGQGCV